MNSGLKEKSSMTESEIPFVGSEQHSDHLLLFPDQPCHRGKLFFDRDWSQAWSNFLLQEAGTCASFKIKNFAFESLQKYRFVYLPRSLKKYIRASHRDFIKAYVESGGTLILEGDTASALGFEDFCFEEKIQTLKNVTGFSEARLPEALAQCIKKMPFHTVGWELKKQSRDYQVLLEMENIPVLFKRSVGRGKLFVLGFDLGLLLVGLQQGIPALGEQRLHKIFGTQKEVIEPEDLVLKKHLLNNALPYADLFERFLFKVFTQDHPVPSWWYFPSSCNGAVISSHDEEALGDDPRVRAMVEEEKKKGASFYTFCDFRFPN